MTRKRGRGTPRLLRPSTWKVARLERWHRLPGDPVEDVAMLTVDGAWEHGQRQEVRVPFPVGEVRSIAHALLDAVPAAAAGALEAGQGSPPPLASSSPVVASSSVASGVAAGVQGPDEVAGGLPLASASSGPVSYRRAHLLEELRRRMAEHFGTANRAGSAWLNTALRKHEVPTVEDLPTPALAQLVNQLIVAPPSRFTPQGDSHAPSDTPDS